MEACLSELAAIQLIAPRLGFIYYYYLENKLCVYLKQLKWGFSLIRITMSRFSLTQRILFQTVLKVTLGPMSFQAICGKQIRALL